MNYQPDPQGSQIRKYARKLIALLGLAFLLVSVFVIPYLPPGRNSGVATNPSTSISKEGVNSGIGKNLTAFEFAQSTNASIAINLPNNQTGTYKLASIDTPPEWTGYKLFSGVSGLTDNNSWLENGNLNTNQSWYYDEWDLQNWDNGLSRNTSENSWGWYENSSWVSGGGGALYLNHGYKKETYQPIGDPQDSREYCAFNQTIFIDRGSVSAVKVIFNLNVTGQMTGWDTVFISINGFRADFHVFDGSHSTNTWYRKEYDMPLLEIPTYFSTPSNVVFKIGIRQQTSGCYWESTTSYRDAVLLDNISIYLQAAAKPSQVQLKINSTTVQDFGYGAGNVTLNTPCPNPSSVSYLPTWANFTIGNSTDVKLTTSLTQYVNHTQSTKVYAGDYGSEFTVRNNSICNWTGYFYASTPNLHSQYNFSIFYPSDWTPWALFDPSPTEVLTKPGITVGSGILSVGSVRANDFPGRWRMEFNSPNYLAALTSYRNTTISPGPIDWTPVDGLFAGDYLNITAQVSGSESVTSSTAQLEIRFPNGTVWGEHSQIKPVDASGMVYFDSLQIPEAGPDYVAGSYTAFVTWNNTRGATQCNETGLRSKVISIKHLAQLTPDNPILNGVINGTIKKIRVSYNDLLSGAPITGATVLLNLEGSVQQLAEIATGYYSADLLVAVSGSSGSYPLNINATHPHFSLEETIVTLDVILDTTLTSSIYPTVAVQSNANFSLDLTYLQKTTGTGIDGATILLDYDPKWELTLTPQGGGSGKYVLEGNNSQFEANTIQKIDISVQLSGYQTQNLSINVKITPRTAVFQTIYMNSTNNTLVPTYKMNITTWLNLSVQLCDELQGTPLVGSEVNITGVDALPVTLTPVGEYYEILLDSSTLGKGVHFLTLEGYATNYVLATTVIQVSVEQLATKVRTDDDKTIYYKEEGQNFAFKIRIDDLVFGGNITAYKISYEWRYGSGNLTGPDAEGYFTGVFTNLPKGTWTITIRVAGVGSDYAFDDLLIKLTVTEPVVEGIPEWVIYTLIGAIAAVIVIFALYETRFKYPPIIRDVRAMKKQVKKGKAPTVEVRGKDVSKTFTEGYLAESKGVLTSTQQDLLKEQHIKAGKGVPMQREVTEIAAPPPAQPAEPETIPAPSVAPTQEPVKLVPEVPKPAAVTPAPTPAPAPVPATKPVTPPIAPIPERFLEMIKDKQVPAVKPLPQIKELPTVKPLLQVKELPTKTAAKPAPKPEEKQAETSGEEDK